MAILHVPGQVENFIYFHTPVLRILGPIKFCKGPLKISNGPLKFSNLHVLEWDMGHWNGIWAIDPF